MAETIRLALLASRGDSSTVAAILDAINEKRLPGIEPALVISSKAGAGVIEKALARGIAPENIVVIPRAGRTEVEFGKEIAHQCWRRRASHIGQYGWLPHTPGNLLWAYDGKMVNQHPGALDPERSTHVERHPDFGGPGMYGRRAIAAALYFARMADHNWWVEATTHLVFPVLDSGPLVRFKRVDIEPHDTVESIQARLLPVEHEVQIAALADLTAHGGFRTIRRPEPLILRQHYHLLTKAKQRAIEDYPNG